MCAVLSGPIEPRIRRRMPVGRRRAAKRLLRQRLDRYGRRSGAIDEAIGVPGAVTAAAGDAAAPEAEFWTRGSRARRPHVLPEAGKPAVGWGLVALISSALVSMGDSRRGSFGEVNKTRRSQRFERNRALVTAYFEV
jgi:hypothetical protein